MVLNHHQRIALALWLGEHSFGPDSQLISMFDEFCDGKIREWRVIPEFGFAGKIWNNDDRIYVSGYSGGELGGFESEAYKTQQEKVDKINEDLANLMRLWGG
jgi:hypothetical protein